MPNSQPAVDEAPPPRAVVDEDSLYQLKRIRRYLFFLLLLAVLTAVYFTRDVLLPIVIALILMLTLLPLVRWLERRSIPSGVSAVVIVLGLAGLVGGMGYALSGPMQQLATEAPAMADAFKEKAGGILDRVRRIQEQADAVAADAAATEAPEAEVVMVDTNGDGEANTPVVIAPTAPTTVVASDKPTLSQQVVSALTSALSSIAAALVLTIFLLAGGDFYHRRIVEAAPRLRDKKQALTIIRDVERQISRYLGAIFTINALLGVAVGVSMWLLGMPMAIVWGFLAFVLNFIPFVGNVLNVILVALVALVEKETLLGAAGPPLVLMLLSLIESNIVTPLFIGRRLELNTVSQLVMVAFWTWIWGVPGAILAVPFLVVVKAITDNVESLQVVSTFLAGDPGTKEDEPPQKATTGPALDTAPLRTQAEAREDSPPTVAPGEDRITPLPT